MGTNAPSPPAQGHPLLLQEESEPNNPSEAGSAQQVKPRLDGSGALEALSAQNDKEHPLAFSLKSKKMKETEGGKVKWYREKQRQEARFPKHFSSWDTNSIVSRRQTILV